MNRFLLAALLIAAPAFAHNGVDHSAHHGGIVRPWKELHYETATLPAGGIQIYFADAAGEPLPASAVAQVALEIAHPAAKTEYVDMAIDPTGVFWTGKTLPLTDTASTLRIGFTFHGAAASVEVPGAPVIAASVAAARKKPVHVH
jgi:hypothetical protein